MALGLKYTTTYCDVYGDDCLLQILEEGYSGGVTELDATPEPFLVNYDTDDDFKFSPIRSATATINLVLGSGTDLEEFWTTNERKFQVIHSVGGTTDFIGWVVPNGFRYQLTGGLYEAQLEATDGLKLLKSQDFLDDTGEYYGVRDISPYHTGFEFEPILILTEILKKTGINLITYVLVDIYEQTMTKDAASRLGCPLAQCTFNVKTYINDGDDEDIPYWKQPGEAFDCLQVLENLCKQFGAKIYQEKGGWYLKRINADIDPGSGATTRYFYGFTTAAEYITRKVNNTTKAIDCLDRPNQIALIGDDHTLAMDEVYKRFRVNYKYTYGRLGDSDLNLIENGNFDATGWDNVTITSAPTSWVRFRYGTKWYPKIQAVNLSASEALNTNGITTALEFGTQPVSFDPSNLDPYAAIWSGIRPRENFAAKQGDKWFFGFYAKSQKILDWTGFGVAFRIVFSSDDGRVYEAVRKYELNPETQEYSRLLAQAQWRELESEELTSPATGQVIQVERQTFFVATRNDSVNIEQYQAGSRDAYAYLWDRYEIELDAFPGNGRVAIRLHGLVATTGRDSDNFPAFKTLEVNSDDLLEPKPVYKTVRRDFVDEGGSIERLQITGVSINPVVNESDRPEYYSYIQNNSDPQYSLQVEPMEVLHGDTTNRLAISKIDVPTVTGLANFWDTIDDAYGKSTSGLVLAKSVMEIYGVPRRILEGDIQVQDAQYGDIFSFDAVPGIAFVLANGTFFRKRGYIEGARFVEIGAATINPDDGSENNFNTDPIWEAGSGRSGDLGPRNLRCELDGSGQNTGVVQFRERDVNPNSPTYGNVRWTNGPTNLASCPIGDFPDYYWGTDDATLDINNLEAGLPEELQPLDNLVNLQYSNPGGNYIYLVHKASLGDVVEVQTKVQRAIISDFTYQSNITIDGLTYRVLRQDYITATYDIIIRYEF